VSVESIADLPFPEREPLALLHLDEERESLVETTDHGWARLREITLAAGGQTLRVRDPLLLALHWYEDGEPLAGDVELEIDVGAGESVTVLLSRFLDVWLPRLGGTGPVVLAVCNPHRATLPRPPAAGDRTVYYGLGDVESWLIDGSPRLVADEWRVAS
jgi:hypothetical protein